MPVSKKSKYYDEETQTGTNLYLTLPRRWKMVLEYIVINEKFKGGKRVRQRDIASDFIILSIQDYLKKNKDVYDKVKDLIKEDSNV